MILPFVYKFLSSYLVIPLHDLVRMLLKYVDGFWNKLFFAFRSHFYDLYYHTITRQKLNEFLAYWTSEMLPQLTYTSECFDCDDFAFLFKALMVKFTGKNCCLFCGGYVYYGNELLGGHAWNVVLLSNQLVFIEPQTGEILKDMSTADGFKYKLLWVVG